MDNIFIDFESWYKGKYGLRHMPALQYIRDPRFKLFGMGIARNNEKPIWVSPENIEKVLREYEIWNHRVICHRVIFDGCIIYEKYKLAAKQWACTEGLSRAFLPFDKNGLDHIGMRLGIGGKLQGGKLLQLENPTPEQLAEIGEYCCDDIEKTRIIWNICSPHQPEHQLKLQHIIARWAIQPLLQIDVGKMELGVRLAIEARDKAIADSGLPESVLSSNKQFGEWLDAQGITRPTKISKTTEEETDAFGKNDPEFIELMVNHPNLQHVWAGRLAAKSNISVTRPQRMLDLAKTGPFPMPLNYWGAHTGRKSGTDKLNVQNLPNA